MTFSTCSLISKSYDRRLASLPEFLPINNSAMVILYYRFFKLGKRWRIKCGIFYLKMMCFQYGWRCWWDDRSEEALLSGGGKKVQLRFQAFFFSPHSLWTRWFIPVISTLATVFKGATQWRIAETDTLVHTKQGVLPEVGNVYLIYQQASEHAKEPLWPQNRC